MQLRFLPSPIRNKLLQYRSVCCTSSMYDPSVAVMRITTHSCDLNCQWGFAGYFSFLNWYRTILVPISKSCNKVYLGLLLFYMYICIHCLGPHALILTWLMNEIHPQTAHSLNTYLYFFRTKTAASFPIIIKKVITISCL